MVRYRGTLRWTAERIGDAPTATLVLDAHRPGRHVVAPWKGVLLVEAVDVGGVSIAVATSLQIRARAPGDRFQSGSRRPSRSLKLQYQSAGVPAQEREGPVFCCEGRIVFVPGLGIDARFLAAAGEPQIALTWLASEA